MSIDPARLIRWMPEQRWFGSKSRSIARLEILDQTTVEDGPPELVLALARVDFEDAGPGELYHLPLLVHEDGSCSDALTDPGRLAVFGELLAHGATLKGEAGTFDFLGPGLDPLAPPGRGSVRYLGAEQTNSSLVLDEQVILKLFRRLDVGPNPELEFGRLLTDRQFEHVPAHVGDISYTGEIADEEVEIDLGLAQQFETGVHDGWNVAWRQLHAFYDDVHPEDVAEDRRALTEQRAAWMLDALAELGEATATLHIILSTEDPDPDFLPEPIEPPDLKRWAAEVRASLAEETAAEARLAELTAFIEARIDELEAVPSPGLKTRVHGDLHLAQVLSTQRGWMILDFEGEPARPLADRRQKQSPLRDVAGMLRSFDYAASAVLLDRTEIGSDEWQRLEPWANAWEEAARERFLGAYLRRSYEGKFLPGDRGSVATLLDVFEIDKALYELRYERGHRPEWARIPLRGIERVARRDAPA
ncbi:MAG: hypothetical protein ABR575_01075 [Actinomycetota bacterium]